MIKPYQAWKSIHKFSFGYEIVFIVIVGEKSVMFVTEKGIQHTTSKEWFLNHYEFLSKGRL